MAIEGVQTINRAMLTVKARQPYCDWLRKIPEMADMTLEELNRDRTVYMVPEYDTTDEIPQMLQEVFQTIFEIELESWWLESSDWPDTTDYELFTRWFEVEVYSTAFDLASGPVELEDL